MGSNKLQWYLVMDLRTCNKVFLVPDSWGATEIAGNSICADVTNDAIENN
jgi:hypothetical protein